MRIKILGCGTSTGVPIPGCKCGVCLSGDPRNHRTRASALIVLPGGAHILIDTSIDLRVQALRSNIDRIDAVLFTHGHSDHILGLDDLRGFNYSRPEPISCYATGQTLTELRRVFHYAFNPPADYQGGLLVQARFNEIHYYQPFRAAGQVIDPLLLMHGSMQVAGFRIGDFAYATDCSCIPENSIERLRGVKCLILDGLRHEPHATHFSISQAIEASRRIGAERTYLTHMTHTVDYSELCASMPAGVWPAFDGLEIDLGAA